MSEPAEALLRSFDHPVSLSVFEGPLDLLLFLIRRHEIDIYDIPIESITRRYLETLRDMTELRLEIAGEFFVMAATLMYIKSRMLLPADEQPPAEDDGAADEGADPRWELVQQLLEYRKFKDAAARLAELAETSADYLPRMYQAAPLDSASQPLQKVDRIALWNVFNLVLRRLSEKLVIGQIHDEVITVADRMEAILARLRRESRFLFTDLCAGSGPLTPQLLVATFLAILELARLGQIGLEQEEAFADIRIERRVVE
jgi:segregation and condensation protein A